MFDIARVSEAVGGMIGQASDTPGADGLLQQMPDGGMDLSQLEGLHDNDLSEVFKQSGLDIARFDVAELSEMAGRFAEDGGIQSVGDLVTNLTQRS